VSGIAKVPVPFGSADLTSCDREQIHLAGAIQGHGLLLTLTEPDLVIEAASANVVHWLGRPMEQLIGVPLASLFPAGAAAELTSAIAALPLEANPLYLGTVEPPDVDTRIHLTGHRFAGRLLIEGEIAQDDPTTVARPPHVVVKEIMTTVLRAPDVAGLGAAAAVCLRGLLGCDRAWVYRFHPDDHGEIIAEDIVEGLTPYLGLHYPAGDIPLPARELFLRSWVRIIHDAAADPIPLIGRADDQATASIDMSSCLLRAVSPIHRQYVTNMGFRSTMSISLIHEGRLWGLISCQHRTPLKIPFDVRIACELLAQMVSMRLGTVEAREDGDYKLAMREGISGVVKAVAGSTEIGDRLASIVDSTFDWLRCSGVAVVDRQVVARSGMVPDDGAVRDLLSWIETISDEPATALDDLGRSYPAAPSLAGSAAGVLAISVTRRPPVTIAWFRPEVEATVRWGGEPVKDGVQTADGLRLSPRESFEEWRETVTGKSEPWLAHEVAAARELQSQLIATVGEQAETLAIANEELRRSNIELDAFAHVTSHDLKEPLRGIYHYTGFLTEDYSHLLDNEGRQHFETLGKLAQRMEDLIDSLLRYSRTSKFDLVKSWIPMARPAHDAAMLVGSRFAVDGVALEIDETMPLVYADEDRVVELLANLIGNAAKYNDKQDKRITVRCTVRGGQPGIFSVVDNGIGIDPEYHDAVFRIFRRLHPRDAYGGGTGSGLAIVHRIVERHGGRLWLESKLGQGSAFSFTLPPQPDDAHLGNGS